MADFQFFKDKANLRERALPAKELLFKRQLISF